MTDILQQDETARRLDTEEIVWLTSVTGDGQPQSSPVWFIWDGDSFWTRSQAHAAKVRNIEGNARVSLHLSDDGHGGRVVTVDGTARFEDPPDDLFDRYVVKYAEGLRTMQVSADQLAADYPVTIRISPTRTRAW